MKDRLPAIAFVASTVALASVYGVYAEKKKWFPARQITQAEITVRDISSNWKNDLALEPTRHLVEGHDERRSAENEGYQLYEPDAVPDGYTLVAGLANDQDRAAFSVRLYDAEGQVRYVWPIDYSQLDPEGLKPLNVMLHGMEVFEDGSIAVTFDAGKSIARLDACGKPMWDINEAYHHSITRDGKGSLWAWREHVIVELDEDTGEVLSELSLEDDILKAAGGQQGVFGVRTFVQGEGKPITYAGDAFHANDVEPLRAEMADAFPLFEEGDLLISLRELNLVAVVAPDTGELRWYRHGPWLKQHDPDFQPDGTITVFDNNSGTESAKIRRIDPVTNETEILFEGTPETPFDSWQRGKHQVLGNGNILVTEAQHGRIFSAMPDGRLAWERDMVWDEERNLIVTEARHIPPDFFTDGVPSCDSAPAAAEPEA